LSSLEGRKERLTKHRHRRIVQKVRFKVGPGVARDEQERELGAVFLHPVGHLAAAQDRHHEIADHEVHRLGPALATFMANPENGRAFQDVAGRLSTLPAKACRR